MGSVSLKLRVCLRRLMFCSKQDEAYCLEDDVNSRVVREDLEAGNSRSGSESDGKKPESLRVEVRQV